MNCIICGDAVRNIDNKLQKKVREFQKSYRLSLDIKHEWIKNWKICLNCCEKYSSEDIEIANQYLSKKNNVKPNQVANRILNTKQKREKETRKAALQNYINDQTDFIMYHGKEGGYKKKNFENKLRKKYDDDYISYVEKGESAAVFLIRDCVGEIKTDGMWIDILSLDTYEKYGRIGFNYIIAELFPRKQKPEYPPYEKNTDLIAYITWKTAVVDIGEQRQKGVRGPKYLILSHLYNENKGKVVNKIVYWDMTHKKFTDQKKSNDGKRISLPQTPCWKYDIRTVKKVTYKNINYIEDHKDQILERIRGNKKTDIIWFIPGGDPQR